MLRQTLRFGLLLLLLISACMVQTAPSIRPASKESADQLAFAEIESDPHFQSFISALNQRGFELDSTSISRIGWLHAAPGVGYRVGRFWMNIHLYPDATAAEENADEIPEDVSLTTTSWIAPPHFFLCDRIIALYLGSDDTVLATLTDLCGPRFAGFP